MTQNQTTYKYRPVLFFCITYFFTWIFWIPAAAVSENRGAFLMVLGLFSRQWSLHFLCYCQGQMH